MTAESTHTGPVTAGVTGRTPCPNCGSAYDDHGVGGNCTTTLKHAMVRARNKEGNTH